MTVSAPRLLIRLGSMGDVILATAAATAYKRRAPASPLDVLVKEEWAPLWSGHPAVRRVVRWTRGRGALQDTAARLRATGYAEALDLQGSPRTRMLTAVAGIPARGRPRRHALQRRALVRWKRGGPPAGYSVLESFVTAADPSARDLPLLVPSAAAERRAQALLGGAHPVLLAPGARHATKRWPVERFAELGRRLEAEGTGPVAVCFGPGEDALREAWTWGWGDGPEWIAVAEPLDVTAAVVQRSRVVVCGDTGLMHMAAAVGTPVVAVFGPTVTRFGFRPAGVEHRVLETELSCRPCSVHGTSSCPQGHFRCMLEVTPAAVEAAVRAVAPARPAAR